MPLFGPPNIENLKARRNVEGLIKALGYKKDAKIRSGAAVVLGEIGDTRAIEPLIPALQDKLVVVRANAAEALGKICDTRAVEPLIAALQDNDKDVHKIAAEALGKIGSPAVEPLIAALQDSSEYVRSDAAEALERIGWQPDQDESGAYYWIVKQQWAKCVKMGAPAIEPLIAALKDFWVRNAAIEALGKIGDAAAVKPLVSLLDHEETTTRQAAARALVALYQGSKLDRQAREQILQLRAQIETRHADKHIDEEDRCNNRINQHTDHGIGVDFPL